MKVYRVDQLNIGKGGNTPLCPFDCDCCFFSVCWIMHLWGESTLLFSSVKGVSS